MRLGQTSPGGTGCDGKALRALRADIKLQPGRVNQNGEDSRTLAAIENAQHASKANVNLQPAQSRLQSSRPVRAQGRLQVVIRKETSICDLRGQTLTAPAANEKGCARLGQTSNWDQAGQTTMVLAANEKNAWRVQNEHHAKASRSGVGCNSKALRALRADVKLGPRRANRNGTGCD